MLWWILQNTLAIGVLSVIVALACRLGRFRPAVQHVLWLVVLLKFLTPTVVYWPWTLAQLSGCSSHATTAKSNRQSPQLLEARCDETLEYGVAQDSECSSCIQLVPRDGMAGAASSLAADDPSLGGERADVPRLVAERNVAMVPSLTNGPAEGDLRDDPSTVPVPATSSSTTAEHARKHADTTPGPLPRLIEGIAGVADQIAACVERWRIGAWSSVGLVAGLQMARLFKSQRKLSHAQGAPHWLGRQVRRLSAKLGVHEPPTLVVPGIASPVVWCFGRAKLLWPAALARPGYVNPSPRDASAGRQPQSISGDTDRWEGVIAHELAHLRRHDHWIAWLELIAVCVWWWNPLFWYVRRRVRETAEWSCDAWAVWAVPDGERTFAESLLEVTRLVSRTGTPVPAVGVSTGARRSFERRLTMILCERVPCKLPWRGLMAAGILALLAVPGWMAAQEPIIREPAPPSQSAAGTGDVSADALPQELPSQPVGAPSRTGAASTGPTASGVPATQDPNADRISRLEQKVEALLQSLRNEHMQRAIRLDAADRMLGRTKEAANVPSPMAAAPDGKTIAVVGDGTISLLDVATGKEMRRFNIPEAKKPTALAFRPDGKILFARTDDGVVQIDVSSGSWFKTADTWESTPVDWGTPSAVTGPAPDPADRRITATQGTTGRRPAARSALTGAESTQQSMSGGPTAAFNRNATADAAALAPGGAQLDLVKLATEFSDAVGNVKLAQGRLDIVRRQQDQGIGNALDVLTAQVNLETSSNKVQLLRAIAEAAADATKLELEYVHKLAEKGYAPASQEAQGKARLRILDLILK